METEQILAGGLVIGILVVSLALHEAAHAFVANLCGDSTARDMGRLTLDPLRHIDPVMTILLPAALWFFSGGRFLFGGAKPVPVTYHRLRNPPRDMMLVALAGPLSNFLIAVLLMAIWKTTVFVGGMHPDQLAPYVLQQSVQWNLVLAAFNLLPIPPLDGSRVVNFLLPAQLRPAFMAMDRLSMLLIFGLLFLGVLWKLVMPVINVMYDAVNFLTGGVW